MSTATSSATTDIETVVRTHNVRTHVAHGHGDTVALAAAIEAFTRGSTAMYVLLYVLGGRVMTPASRQQIAARREASDFQHQLLEAERVTASWTDTDRDWANVLFRCYVPVDAHTPFTDVQMRMFTDPASGKPYAVRGKTATDFRKVFIKNAEILAAASDAQATRTLLTTAGPHGVFNKNIIMCANHDGKPTHPTLVGLLRWLQSDAWQQISAPVRQCMSSWRETAIANGAPEKGAAQHEIAVAVGAAMDAIGSWYALDQLAMDEKRARFVAYDDALNAILPRGAAADAMRVSLETALQWMVDRSTKQADHVLFAADHCDRRSCEAMRSTIRDGRFDLSVVPTFQMPTRERGVGGMALETWSHPDWKMDGDEDAHTGFIQQARAAGHEQALVTLIQGDGAVVAAYGACARHAGRATMTPNMMPSLSMTTATSGGNAYCCIGTLETAYDTAGNNAYVRTLHDLRRVGRGQEGTLVIRSAISWLGQTLSCAFHVGRNRDLSLKPVDEGWHAVFNPNRRQQHDIQDGVIKTPVFRLVRGMRPDGSSDPRLELSLPINVRPRLHQRQRRLTDLDVEALRVGGYTVKDGKQELSHASGDPAACAAKIRASSAPSTLRDVLVGTLSHVDITLGGFDAGLYPAGGWSIASVRVTASDGHLVFTRQRELANGTVGPARHQSIRGLANISLVQAMDQLHLSKRFLNALAPIVMGGSPQSQRMLVDLSTAVGPQVVLGYTAEVQRLGGSADKQAARRAIGHAIRSIVHQCFRRGEAIIAGLMPMGSSVYGTHIPGDEPIVLAGAGHDRATITKGLKAMFTQACITHGVAPAGVIATRVLKPILEVLWSSQILDMTRRAVLQINTTAAIDAAVRDGIIRNRRDYTGISDTLEQWIAIQRNATAVRCGFADADQVFRCMDATAGLGSLPHDRLCEATIVGKNILCDLWDRWLRAAGSLCRIGLATRALDETVQPQDDDWFYHVYASWRKTSTANRRSDAMARTAARILHIAQQHGCDAMVIEALDMKAGDQSPHDNNLAASVAASAWRETIRNAAARTGLPLVMVSASNTSRTITTADDGTDLPAPQVGHRVGRSVYQWQPHQAAPIAVDSETNAARNILGRALSNDGEHYVITTQRLRPDLVRLISARPVKTAGAAASGVTTDAKWVQRMANSLGRDVRDLYWQRGDDQRWRLVKPQAGAVLAEQPLADAGATKPARGKRARAAAAATTLTLYADGADADGVRCWIDGSTWNDRQKAVAAQHDVAHPRSSPTTQRLMHIIDDELQAGAAAAGL